MKIIPQIKYKSILAKIKDVEERNEVFNSLDKQSQRLEIAWEALNISLMPSIIPSNGCYWSDSLLEISGGPKELQDTLVNNLPGCSVCERGLIMLAQIRLGNEVHPEDKSRDDGSKDNVKGFGIDNMREMESEYESSYFKHPYYTHTKKKMANICCNVLINGNFNSKDKRDYLLIKNT